MLPPFRFWKRPHTTTPRLYIIGFRRSYLFLVLFSFQSTSPDFLRLSTILHACKLFVKHFFYIFFSVEIPTFTGSKLFFWYFMVLHGGALLGVVYCYHVAVCEYLATRSQSIISYTHERAPRKQSYARLVRLYGDYRASYQ